MNEDENGNPIAPDDDEKVPMHVKVINLVTVIMFVLIQIFVMIRLDQYTLWDWFSVFVPWFVYEGIPTHYHSHPMTVPYHNQHPTMSYH